MKTNKQRWKLLHGSSLEFEGLKVGQEVGVSAGMIGSGDFLGIKGY